MGFNPVDVSWQQEEEDDPICILEVILVKPAIEITLRAVLMRMLAINVTAPLWDPSSCSFRMPMRHPFLYSQNECALARSHAILMRPPLVKGQRPPPLRLRPRVGRSNLAPPQLALPFSSSGRVAKHGSEVLFCVLRSQRRGKT